MNLRNVHLSWIKNERTTAGKRHCCFGLKGNSFFHNFVFGGREIPGFISATSPTSETLCDIRQKNRELMPNLNYNHTDAWILNAIANSQNENFGANLFHIIAYADYTNHAIITFAELNISVQKLFNAGLVEILDNKNLILTDVYKNWLDKKLAMKTRFSILKIIDDTQKFLQTISNDKPHDFIKDFLEESLYNKALEKYLNEYH